MNILKNKENIFKKRRNSKIIFFSIIITLYVVSSLISSFENMSVFLTVPKGVLWLFKNFIPTKNSIKYIPTILKTAFNTVMMAISATTFSSIFAFIFAVLGSEIIGVNKFFKMSIKIISSFFRNMPILTWSILLLFSFKQGELTGLFALIFVTFGYLTRTFSETIDEVSGDVIEALEATGASWWQIVFQGVIPTTMSQLISWVLYYVENSVREVTLIGILTGTGLGFIFNMYYRSFRYDVAGLVILIVIILVILIELLSNKLRKNDKYLQKVLIFLVCISTFKIFNIDKEKIVFSTAINDFFKNMKLLFFEAKLSERYSINEIIESLLITVALAILTTIIGAFISLFLSFFAAKNLSNEKLCKIIKVTMSFIRAVPTILWVLVFSVVAGIGVEAAVIGMVFHSVAYLVKAYSESIEEIDNGTIEALKSTGASWWQIIFQGVLPSSISSILSWTFVRFEINFTNAVVVGAASGAGGIGYPMFMAGKMYFDIKEIGFFTYIIFIIAIILETISIYLRKKYILNKNK